MDLFEWENKTKRKVNWQLFIFVVIGLGICGYLYTVINESYPGILQKLPAAISKLTPEKPVSEEMEEVVEEISMIEEEREEYIEVAEKGEGITHLARRALKRYLQDNPQSFEVTPEHKVYIEDYLAKKMGGGWLRLGETLEFSEDLIKEAIEKSENLSPEDLENLTQYSQLVPSLIY